MQRILLNAQNALYMTTATQWYSSNRAPVSSHGHRMFRRPGSLVLWKFCLPDAGWPVAFYAPHSPGRERSGCVCCGNTR